MTISELYEMAISKDFDAVLSGLEKMTPYALNDFAEEFKKHGKSAGDDFLDHLSDEQYKRFKYLDSSERRREYIMQIPDEKMTERDWTELRATDF